jgi:flagellar hook assembly protein FlgD
MIKIVKIICLFAALILGINLYALEMKDVIAAPVPLNPNTSVLSIMNLPNYDSFTLEVYDITGDKVVTKEYNVPAYVKWNGRNSFGKIVKPGMYILKITAKDTKTDAYGTKKIKILVKY